MAPTQKAMAPTQKAGTTTVPRPPKLPVKKAVGPSSTSSAPSPVEAMAVPERRTPPRPNSDIKNEIEAKPEVAQTKAPSDAQRAMEEMSKRAAQTRGIPSEGAAPVTVPRKKANPDSIAVKALEAKKDEIAQKIASGSVAAPSKSMAVVAPTRLSTSTNESSPIKNAPSIKERYATEGSAPIASKPSENNKSSKQVLGEATANSPEVKQAQAVIENALKDISSATGKAIHIHVHAPVHIHLGPSKI